MNLMHPEVLRAIAAALSCRQNPTIWGPAPAIESADAILDELAKTAKPEAELDAMTFQLDRDMLAWRHKAWENATRAEAAEARVKELEATLQTARAEGAREERERIIDVLDKTDYGMVVGWRGFKRDELVRLLEPKP